MTATSTPDRTPRAESFDLVVKVNSYDGKDYWYWDGSPMSELRGVQGRLKRKQKAYGDKLLGYRIVSNSLNQVTGVVTHTIVEESAALPA